MYRTLTVSRVQPTQIRSRADISGHSHQHPSMSSIFLRSLRCVARGPGRLQFSTKVPVANDNTPSTGPKTPDPNLDDFKELAEYLQGEEGGGSSKNYHSTYPHHFVSLARTLDRDVPSGKWKGFRPNSVCIYPHAVRQDRLNSH